MSMNQEKKRVISIIPARGGSKGISRKNVVLLNKKPLIYYSIRQSINSTLIDETIVSTDDDEIASISRRYGATVIKRPSYLATDTASTESVIEHVLQFKKADVSVLLQPTSPLRGKQDVNNVLKLIEREGYDSVFSVSKNNRFIWRVNKKLTSFNYDYKNRKRRQDFSKEYIENGSIYAFKTKTFLVEQNRICGNFGVYVMHMKYSFEIDEPFDLKLCEKIMEL